MPRKKKGQRNNAKNKEQKSRELLFAEPGQVYGKVIKVLGDSRCEVHNFDGIKRQCKIRGTMRKREYIRVGDIILVSKRDFQDEKGDIIHLYTSEEVANLRLYDEIPKNIQIGLAPLETSTDDCAFVFDDI